MIAIPAVDLRDGACVQLVGGRYSQERVRLADPLAVARAWVQTGFRSLHVVDLDAATGAGENEQLVATIVEAGGAASVQVGGGIRTTDAVQRLVGIGVRRIVVGTRALEEPDWLADLAQEFPDVLVVAADVNERSIVTRGWTRALRADPLDVVEELNALPLAALLVTAVHREGQMCGPDLELTEELAAASRFPLIASGGIATMRDLNELQDRGAAAAVIGMALYTGALDARAVAREFAE
jgi:phosphoribosylformimino-5-aminoimidazole carboxamide ribotide isomerase